MDKRYQVFISSTYEDLKRERDAVIKAVLEMGHFPVGMEMFNAADEEQWVTIQREIDRSDYYLLVVAHRYGSTIAMEGGISYTEKEFNYAVATGVPRIGFVIANGVSWEPKFVDEGRQKKRLDAFKSKVKGRPVDFWMSKDDLATKVVLSLGKLIANTDRPGWQRGGKTNDEVVAAMARLTEENTDLRRENERLKSFGVANPKLQFYFVDDHGESLGDVLTVDLADANAYNEKIAEGVFNLQKLVNQYDHNRKLGRAGSYHSSNLYHIKINQDRIDTLVNRLKKYEISNIPVFKFPNLHSDTNPSYSKEIVKPTGGLDFANYSIFANIEAEITAMILRSKAYQDQKNSFSYRIDCRNNGRVAAEHIQIKINSQSKPENIIVARDAKNISVGSIDTEKLIGMIIPHDSSEVVKKRLNKSNISGEVLINILVLAKNLPEPQEYQLKIVFKNSSSPIIVK